MTDSLIPPDHTLTRAKVITLFEYETTDQLDSQELIQLSRLSRRTGIEILRPSLRDGKTCFQARQYVGAIRLGHRTIQILPKIYSSSDREQSEREAAQNLLFMLDHAGYLGIREVGLAALQRSQNWFEVLVYLFATHLKRQWQRGAPRNYQPIENNIPVLKGKWQIATQIRRPEQKHRFAVIYDEFTTDNLLNRLLRYVVESLWRLTQDSLNRKHLSDLRYWMDEVALLPTMSSQDAAKIQLTRLNEHYRPLLNLARLFLDNIGLQLSADSLPSFSFVFDMNQLFERFLTAFIRRYREIVLPDNLKHCELLTHGQRAAKYLANYQGKPIFHLRPDLVFRQGGQYPLLIDFKYKRTDIKARKFGIAESDCYQVYAYLKRFNSPRVLLIYPQTADSTIPLREYLGLEERTQSINAATVDLLKDLNRPGAKASLQSELRNILEPLA